MSKDYNDLTEGEPFLPEEGVHRNVPMEVYVKDPCKAPSISKGVIKRIVHQSPAHARYHHPRLNPECPESHSKEADTGSAVHAAILGGQEVVFAPEEFTDWKKKDARTFRDEAHEANQIPLLSKNRVQMESARDSALETLKRLDGWTGKYEREGVIIWKDGEAWKRLRYDIWAPEINVSIDVKTCKSASPPPWIRTSLMGGGYDIQAAHYLEGIRKMGGGDRRTDFLFLLVEIEPPYCCSFVGMEPEFMELGQRKAALGTRIWNECMQKGEWPGYSVRPHYAEMPSWAESQVVERGQYTEEMS